LADREINGSLYLDWNGSAPVRHEARAAACAALDLTGNPSSVHYEDARRANWSSRRAMPLRRWSKPIRAT